eukprot:TRINITY_DN3938_c1_g1_i6.p2 TRINITY_DN3938_c1_g1~~TRINITY_DN3938_c1_g1_i6.p2  ORF type:complete len:247 (-),score=-55.31 TRINITY_DN3938_c1_g1_i6:270-1010(-)
MINKIRLCSIWIGGIIGVSILHIELYIYIENTCIIQQVKISKIRDTIRDTYMKHDRFFLTIGDNIRILLFCPSLLSQKLDIYIRYHVCIRILLFCSSLLSQKLDIYSLSFVYSVIYIFPIKLGYGLGVLPRFIEGCIILYVYKVRVFWSIKPLTLVQDFVLYCLVFYLYTQDILLNIYISIYLYCRYKILYILQIGGYTLRQQCTNWGYYLIFLSNYNSVCIIVLTFTYSLQKTIEVRYNLVLNIQ